MGKEIGKKVSLVQALSARIFLTKEHRLTSRSGKPKSEKGYKRNLQTPPFLERRCSNDPVRGRESLSSPEIREEHEESHLRRKTNRRGYLGVELIGVALKRGYVSRKE